MAPPVGEKLPDRGSRRDRCRGRELLDVLERRAFRGQIAPARIRSLGRQELAFRGEAIEVEELKADSFAKIDIAFFSAGGKMSRRHVDERPRSARS